MVSNDTINISNPPIRFNNWSISGTYNYLESFSNSLFNKEASYKVTVGLSLFNTNNLSMSLIRYSACFNTAIPMI